MLHRPALPLAVTLAAEGPVAARIASLGSGLAVLAPVALFVAHAALLRHWLIDDAGISFAYARNLAAGHGLVAQPGAIPVEGFSNPLWTLLLTATFRLGLFSLDWTPKALGLLLVAATFGVVLKDLGRSGRSHTWPAMLAVSLLATSTSFVIWTKSGLENPLLACLAAVSCVLVARVSEGESSVDRLAGLTAGLLALTRPEAILYATAFPLSLLLSFGGTRTGLARWTRRVVTYAGALIPIPGSYCLFRRLHFGEWVPNTYYAGRLYLARAARSVWPPALHRRPAARRAPHALRRGGLDRAGHPGGGAAPRAGFGRRFPGVPPCGVEDRDQLRIPRRLGRRGRR
jgi:hypothetical protein